MTSKPTARERFEELTKLRRYDDNTLDFLFSLIEAAIEVDADTGHTCATLNCICKDWIWKRVDQYLAQADIEAEKRIKVASDLNRRVQS